jgi:hypothetical protein
VIGGDIGAGERGIVQVPLHLLAGQDVRGGWWRRRCAR